jgi:hypothetical protein
MPRTKRPLSATAIHEQDSALFVAMELNLRRWIVAASTGESKVRKHTLATCNDPTTDASTGRAAGKPNILVIMGDGVGWLNISSEFHRSRA